MKKRLLIGFVSLILSACGGGGGGGGGSSPSSNSGGPIFTISTTSVSVSADENDSTNPRRTVGGSLAGATGNVFVVVEIPAGGIVQDGSLSFSGTSGSLELVMVAPTMLGVGSYNTNVVVNVCNDANCSSHVSGSPKTVAVDYEVTPTALLLNPSSIQIQAEHRIESSTDATLSVTAGPEAWLAAVTYVSGSDWLTIDPGTFGSLPTTVTFRASGMPPGDYDATVRLETDAGTATLDVQVFYSVRPSELDITQEQVVFNIDQSSISADLSQTIQIRSGTGAPLQWQASVDANWIDLSPLSGATGTSGDLDVTINDELVALVNGTHRGVLTFTSPDPGVSVIEIPIELNKSTRAARFVSPYYAIQGTSDEVIVRGEGLLNLQPGDITVGGSLLTAFTVVDDTELRFDTPLLAVGRYAIETVNSIGVSLDSAELVIGTMPAFPAGTIQWTVGERYALLFDDERHSFYVYNSITREVERYRFNGAGWDFDSVAMPTGHISDIATMFLSNSGEDLLIYSRENVTDNLISIDADAFDVATTHNGGGIRFGIPLNNGDLFSGSSVYSPLRGETTTVVDPSVPASERGLSRRIAVTGDRSRVYMNIVDSSWTGPTFSSYAAGDSLITASNLRVVANTLSTDRTGSIIEFDADIYDSGENHLGRIRQSVGLINPLLSFDGTRAFYIQFGATSSDPDLLIGKDLTMPDGNGGFDDLFAPITVMPNPIIMTLDREARHMFLGRDDRLEILPLP